MAGLSGDPLTKAELEEIRAMVMNGRNGPRASSEAAQVLSRLRHTKSSERREWRRKLRDWKRARAEAQPT